MQVIKRMTLCIGGVVSKKRTVASIKDMRYTISIVKQLLGMGLAGNNVITGYNSLDKANLSRGAKEWVGSLEVKYIDPTL